jgi:hypothetical protein
VRLDEKRGRWEDSIGHRQKNGVVSKVLTINFSPYTATTYTVCNGTVQVSHALPAVRFSRLLRGRGTSFQYGVATREAILCDPF